jgi:hypothetical protein
MRKALRIGLLCGDIVRRDSPEADHTFSTAPWSREVGDLHGALVGATVLVMSR